MKIKIFLLLIIFSILNARAADFDVICPAETLDIIEKESFINKITGLNFASKKAAQMIIEKEIKKELNSDIKADLEIFTVKRLKKGEFKSLVLRGKSIKYKTFSVSDFYAGTICPYNKVFYKKGRIYYPQQLPFKYKSSITNKDIQNILVSDEFQNEIEKITPSVNGKKIFDIQTPAVTIKGGKIYFELPIKSFLGTAKIKFNADISIDKNKLVLKNINFNSKTSLINNDVLIPIIDRINPIYYEINSLNSKYCKIFITKAKISDNIINTEGIFIINKNYNGEK